MLEDRYYMRGSQFDSRFTATVTLLLVNIAVFLVQLALLQFTHFDAARYFALSVEGLKHGYIWQLLTYGFMHAGLLHLIFNCWGIYVFGQDVEEALGRKPFLALYFAGVLIGGLIQALFGVLFAAFFGGTVVGASAGAFALAAAFAMLFPERVLLLFFVIPMRAKYLLLLCGGLTLYGLLSRGDGIAHAAHLGGMLTGVVFVRYAMHWDWHWPNLRRTRGEPPRRLVKVGSPSSARWGRTKPEEDLPADEFLSKEVDPILDKISAHGIQSLTERERRILEAARQKIVKR
jgi:membrane associated rhomboid family serine protease